MSKLIQEFYPQLNIRVVFKPSRTIQSLFKFKDVVPVELQSSIIYKYNCSCCNATYTGRNKRHLPARIHEHQGRSIRTNRPFANPPFSAIRNHCDSSDHPILKESFSVLSCRPHEMELNIAESLYIIKERPSLCNNERSSELLCF